MQKHDVIIYEYNNRYSIIQRSKQDKRQDECPSENVALAGSLPKDVAPSLLGETVLKAIDSYGTIDPSYFAWELKELRKQLCSWVGAKSYTGFLKNRRLVLAQKNFDKKRIEIIPFDNFNINKWETMLLDDMICLPLDSDYEKIGMAVDKAFSIATFHPERKI
ncbi:contact-dependent growth inhibition system immunity protein [Citrobacter sp. S2-9]|uniref:Contact-dependent growth inhibition system immunity protein n=1 Tax=Citrobacter enshiensis TaxID=2971264 RepID=A0ABT8Q1Y3_9ENTR|nr:contact-dependent growth inhibition system immunity protein [Citrobacter enshiensis]MDN8602297.1 contact-dependent growth inhibition system immunity protein [Citrobacter enshiensis]